MSHSSNRYSVGQLIKAALLSSIDLKKAERDTLVAIMSHGNGMGFAEPSTPGVARYVGCSTRTVERIIAKLVELGRLVVKRRVGQRSIFWLPAKALALVLKQAAAADNTPKDPRQNHQEPPTNHGTTPDNYSGDVSDEVGFEVPPEEEDLSRTRESTSKPAPKRRFGDWKRPGWRNGKPILPTTEERCPEKGHEHYWADACTACVADEKVAAAAAEAWVRRVDQGEAVTPQVVQVVDVVPVKGLSLADRIAQIDASVAARKAAKAA